MKFVLTLSIFLFLITSCQSSQKGNEIDDDLETRHGWAVFSGPKRTVIDVHDQNSIQRGETLFAQHCTRCHGHWGKGDGSAVKALKKRPADLTSFSKKHGNFYLVFQINEGKGDMPQWKDKLSSRETWDLSNYIQFLSYGKGK